MSVNNSFAKITFVVFLSFLCFAKPAIVFPGELNDIFFESGSFALDEKAVESLENNIRLLKENPDSRLLLEGYCDEKGDPDLNRELSAKRVRAVKQYIVSHGIQINRISTREIGSTDKFSQNGSGSSLGANRRVHFELQKPGNKNSPGSAVNEEVNIPAEKSGYRNFSEEETDKEAGAENLKVPGINPENAVDFRMRKTLAQPLNFMVPGHILNQQYFTVELEIPDNYDDFLRSEITSVLNGNDAYDLQGNITKGTKFALEGQNFEIERSPVRNGGSGKKSNYESLSWKVKPTREGIQSLILSIKIVKTSDNDKELLEIPLYERVIKVEPGYISSISVIASNYRVALIILSIILILFIMYRNIPGMFPK